MADKDHDPIDLRHGLPDLEDGMPELPMGEREPTAHLVDFRRAERRARVAAMYCRRWSQTEIAKKLGMTQPRVSQILTEIKEMWMNNSILDLNARRVEELNRIDASEREFWEAWRRSQLPREISDQLERQKSGKGKRGQDLDEKQIEGRVRAHDRDGNPAFMQGVLQCIQLRIRLLGLDKVPEVDLEEKFREMAVQLGLDPEMGVRLASEVVRDYETSAGPL